MHGQRFEHLFEQREHERAADGAVECAGAAENDHQKNVAGLMPREDLRIGETGLDRRQVTGETGQRAGDREARQLVPKHVIAEREHPVLVDFDAVQRASERRSEQRSEEQKRGNEHCQHEIEELVRIAEIDERDVAELDVGLEVHRDAVRAAAEVGVVENEVEHLGERERHHDEVDAACAQNENADQRGRDGRCADRSGQREP